MTTPTDRPSAPNMNLTARELMELNEITSDKAAADHAFKIAMNYNMNRHAELSRLEQRWWDDALAVRHITRDEKTGYRVNSFGPIAHIEPITMEQHETLAKQYPTKDRTRTPHDPLEDNT